MRAAALFCGPTIAAILLLALGLTAAPRRAIAANDHAPYLIALQRRAAALGLARRPEWLRLLHMEPGSLGALESQISDPLFFLAKRGRRNPQAELNATLAGFFGHPSVAGESVACRFHARYEWLDTQLHFNPQGLPPPSCPALTDWLKALDVGRIYVVFAANDLDSPASMFGHTLLRVDQKTEVPGERYLAYAVNYAAQTGTVNGMSYALRGLTGNFTGYYSVMPYYDKIRQYEGFDHRDLWEYPLRLDARQKQMLLWHLWELRGIGSRYYFFSRNCSYELLTLLAVTVPTIDLTRRFDRGIPYAIPIDTVRRLRDAGLVGKPLYQPSAARRLRWRYGQLGAPQRAWVRGYVDGRRKLPPPGGPAQQAGELEVAHEALYYHFQNGSLKRAAGLPRDRAALLARSKIEQQPNFEALQQPRLSPDEGHASGRVSLGMRASDGTTAALLRWRPAYHDRLDPPGGYLKGSEIEFLNLGLLVRPGQVTLADARVLSVQQLGMRDGLFHPWSWQVATGVRRYGLDGERAAPRGDLGGYLEGGPGMAWPLTDHLQAYVFSIAALDVNGSVSGNYALAGGVRAGLAAQWPRGVTSEVSAHWQGRMLGGTVPGWRLRASAQFTLGKQNGLRLTASYGHQRYNLASVELGWEHYF
ncbi:MAG: hypothetical protein B7Z66_11155 [Chromatiales bacterium 21-64-14]|nr:MAG: hypothetical protein B7Z66_11155 [Chromatiales bacterium 21-64-14]HQU16785.1 DUF4105 domain-containing protein [Gammaproteobacteria bacterium]